MTITDDYSRCCEVYFLRSKSEVALNSSNIKITLRHRPGEKLKRFNRITARSIVMPQCTSFSKGPEFADEHKNRTLVESAHFMMIQSGLPLSFWVKAIATAKNIRNQCVTKSLDKGTLFKKLPGLSPDVKYFRTFGCKAYVLDKTPDKRKYKAKGIDGIYSWDIPKLHKDLSHLDSKRKEDTHKGRQIL